MHWVPVLVIIGALGTLIICLFTKLGYEIKSQNLRIDRLYQMFVDFLSKPHRERLSGRARKRCDSPNSANKRRR